MSLPGRHHRRSIRLQGYDYTHAGPYFVTICTQNRACLFGRIVRGEMVLNECGRIVADEWIRTAAIRREIELDEWVVMPNHVHGIVVITGRGDRPVAPTPVAPTPVAPTPVAPAPVAPAPVAPTPVAPAPVAPAPVAPAGNRPTGPHPRSIGAVMAGFKSAASKRINEMRNTPGAPVWQRNYYERIIRDEESLNRIRQYILDNPARWAFDRENPAAGEPEPEDAWLA